MEKNSKIISILSEPNAREEWYVSVKACDNGRSIIAGMPNLLLLKGHADNPPLRAGSSMQSYAYSSLLGKLNYFRKDYFMMLFKQFSLMKYETEKIKFLITSSGDRKRYRIVTLPNQRNLY